jgi:hypothetical protein
MEKKIIESIGVNQPGLQFGNNIKPTERVISLEHVQTENRLVTLMPIIKQKHKEPRASFCSFRDEDGITWGIPIGYKKDGTIQFKRLVVDGSHTFNLARKQEAQEFEIWKNSPFVEGGMKTSNMMPILYVNDPEDKAAKEVELSRIRTKNDMYIQSLEGQKLMDLSLVVFGAGASKNTAVFNMAQLLKSSHDKPYDMAKHIENKMSEVRAVFERACAVNLIQFDESRGYITEKGRFLGYDKEAAITRLASQGEIFRAMDADSLMRLGKGTLSNAAHLSPDNSAQIRMAIQRGQDQEGQIIIPNLGGQPTKQDFQEMSSPQNPWDHDTFEQFNEDAPMTHVATPEDDDQPMSEIAKAAGPSKKKK